MSSHLLLRYFCSSCSCARRAWLYGVLPCRERCTAVKELTSTPAFWIYSKWQLTTTDTTKLAV